MADVVTEIDLGRKPARIAYPSCYRQDP
jgi:hypothetical protein